jgi:hypothetical protein
LIWFVSFVWFVLLAGRRNEKNKINQRTQMNKSDERPEAWRVRLK